MTSLISYYYSNAKTSGRVQEGSKCSNRSKFLAGVLFYGPPPKSIATVRSNNFEKVNGEKNHPNSTVMGAKYAIQWGEATWKITS